jgi:hypothetical protein
MVSKSTPGLSTTRRYAWVHRLSKELGQFIKILPVVAHHRRLDSYFTLGRRGYGFSEDVSEL